MRFSTATKILLAATFAVAPMLHTAATASAQPTSATSKAKTVVAHSRIETSTRLVVSFVANGRQLKMIGDRSNPAATRIDVMEGSRVLVRASVDRNGNASMTNHLGRTYTATQLEANPALYRHFDFDAVRIFEPIVMLYLSTGQGTTTAGNPLCAINPWVAVGCLAGAALAAFAAACDPWAECDEDGCSGGFNCGDD